MVFASYRQDRFPLVSSMKRVFNTFARQILGRIPPYVCRFLPLMSGLAMITAAHCDRYRGQAVSDAVIKLRNGIRVSVDPCDFDGCMLFLFRTHDPKIVAICRSLLREGDHFLDIGANYGAISLMCAQIVGRSGGIHMFEPQPDLCRRILGATSGTGMDWLHLYRVGLMDRDGELRLKLRRNHSGAATFVHDDNPDESILVPVKEVTAFVAPLVDGKAFGVKIDVEGAEMAILPGLMTIPGLRFVVCECISSHEKIWSVLKEAGLTMFGIPKALSWPRVCQVESATQLAMYHDLLAVRLNAPVILTGRIHPGRLAAYC